MWLGAPCHISRDLLGIIWWCWVAMKNSSFFWESRCQRSNCDKVILEETENRFFSSADVLGLTLHWTNSTMRQKHLRKVFPMNQDWVFYSLQVWLACLYKCLLTLPVARQEWPDELRIQSFCLWSMPQNLSFHTSLEPMMVWIRPFRITRIMILKMLIAVDVSASALRATSLFRGLMVMSFTPISMSQVAGTSERLRKTYIQSFESTWRLPMNCLVG